MSSPVFGLAGGLGTKQSAVGLALVREASGARGCPELWHGGNRGAQAGSRQDGGEGRRDYTRVQQGPYPHRGIAWRGGGGGRERRPSKPPPQDNER